jgi:hypothetical protein
MKKFKILQMDGGGLMGVIFLTYLVELEKKLNMSICDFFDMFIGTSTGGIAAGGFACGYTAKEILDFYKIYGRKIFNKRLFGFLNPGSWWTGKYKRKYVDTLVEKMMNKKMGELQKIFICTGVNMKDNQNTHFFKSYKEKYKEQYVYEFIKRTYSAPTFFGYYEDKYGLWADGGVGVHNCTLLESYIETLRLNKKDYYILSCGTGNPGLDYDGKFILNQIKDFIPIARTQAINSQINNAIELGINFDRVNVKISHKHDKMDAWRYIPKFENYGKKMIEENKIITDNICKL